MVPHLTTALTGPLLHLEKRVLEATPAIEHWFRQQWAQHNTPFYTSVDLRNAGFKLAPVDTNLFPAGFNNLNPVFHPLCVQAVMVAIEKICPDSRQFLIIPENHTRNLFYLESVLVLKNILQKAGLRVRIGSLLPDLKGVMTVALPSGGEVTLEPVIRKGNRLGIAGFEPCAILLNNDLSGGIPAILRGLSQPVVPALKAGWSTRLKSQHFLAYDQIVQAFSEYIGIDPWLINPVHGQCQSIDFTTGEGMDCLTHEVDVVLQNITKAYKERDIDAEPFVIVKADAGTYGMGIMTVKSPKDVLALNRKQRNKMSVIKEGQTVQQVLIQEGVYTFETWEGAVAEPVVYMMDHFVVGGFYRVHTERGVNENLNAPGSHFEALDFETEAITPHQEEAASNPPNRFYTYGVVARLALLAAALEIDQMPDIE